MDAYSGTRSLTDTLRTTSWDEYDDDGDDHDDDDNDDDVVPVCIIAL